jgi:hypothetical protein
MGARPVGNGFDRVACGRPLLTVLGPGVLVANPEYWITKSPNGSRILLDGSMYRA